MSKCRSELAEKWNRLKKDAWEFVRELCNSLCEFLDSKTAKRIAMVFVFFGIAVELFHCFCWLIQKLRSPDTTPSRR